MHMPHARTHARMQIGIHTVTHMTVHAPRLSWTVSVSVRPVRVHVAGYDCNVRLHVVLDSPGYVGIVEVPEHSSMARLAVDRARAR